MTAAIATIATIKFFDGSIPAAGGTVEVFAANTLTHAVSWSDRDQATIHQNANPLTLNANGEGTFFLESGLFYDFLVKNSLGATIGNPKGISGSSSGVVSLTPWQVTGLTPTFISTRSFSLVGNQTADYHVGRRVRTTNTGGTKYATIISSVFSSVTTVVLGFQNNTDVLDAGLSAADISTEPYVNPAIMQGNGSIIDLTGYTGVDVALGVGQSAKYSLSAVTSLILRIATAADQEYELNYASLLVSGSTIGTGCELQPNNANTGASEVINQASYVSQTTPAGALAVSNRLALTQGNTLVKFNTLISTKTDGKYATGAFTTRDATLWYGGYQSSVWSNLVTVWTSLGTLQFQNVTSGLLRVTRVL